MSDTILRFRKWRLTVAVLFVFGAPLAIAGNGPLISGSYEVLQDANLGSQQQIRMRIQLLNHGSSDLSIQNMTLWDFSHPDQGGSRACAITVRAHTSAETIQQFVIPRADYQEWKRGMRPRLVLEIAGPHKSAAIVRLDRLFGREAK
jgi:hypothetical protein